jgi:hypothetical protein
MQEPCQKASGFVFFSMHAAEGGKRVSFGKVPGKSELPKDIRFIVQRAFACNWLLKSRLRSEPPSRGQ